MSALYRPVSSYFRRRRMRQFWEEFRVSPTSTILDVGGFEFNWSLLPDSPNVIFLNLAPPADRQSDVAQRWIIADGCALPFADQAFDIVYSNSLIEHLGTLRHQRRFAEECRRVGRRYYVQTPNRWFPVEPHLLTIGIHWLPYTIRRHLLPIATVWGWRTRPTREACEAFLAEVRLLNTEEMMALFPDATIWYERVLGLTKSLIAAKQ